VLKYKNRLYFCVCLRVRGKHSDTSQTEKNEEKDFWKELDAHTTGNRTPDNN